MMFPTDFSDPRNSLNVVHAASVGILLSQLVGPHLMFLKCIEGRLSMYELPHSKIAGQECFAYVVSGFHVIIQFYAAYWTATLIYKIKRREGIFEAKADERKESNYAGRTNSEGY